MWGCAPEPARVAGPSTGQPSGAANATDRRADERARLALAKEAPRHYRWANVAKGVITAAGGGLDELQFPAVAAQ